MDFDKLLKIVLEKNKVEGEKCLICHFPDNLENLEKLNCNHYFHLNCLNLDKIKKANKVICPYCGTKVKIKKNKELNKIPNNLKETVCKILLKSGVNKGKECGRNNCKYHN
jgi:hypothetical protein